MAEDRLKRDFDLVENLDDLIDAREERESAFADDIDGMSDANSEGLPVDANTELTWPHPRTHADEDGAEGINVELLGTPDEGEIEFDWQDSVEEMLPTDPEPNEGMGADATLESIAHVEATDLAGPVPSTDFGELTATDFSEEESEDESTYELDGGEPICERPIPIESGMDTDSDEDDFSIEDKFGGEVDEETAEYESELLLHAKEEEES